LHGRRQTHVSSDRPDQNSLMVLLPICYTRRYVFHGPCHTGSDPTFRLIIPPPSPLTHVPTSTICRLLSADACTPFGGILGTSTGTATGGPVEVCCDASCTECKWSPENCNGPSPLPCCPGRIRFAEVFCSDTVSAPCVVPPAPTPALPTPAPPTPPAPITPLVDS